MFDLVMFGLDGILVDTAPEIRDAVNDTLRVHDLPAISEARVRESIGNGMQELVARSYAHATGWSTAAVMQSGILESLMPVFCASYAGLCGSRRRTYPHVAASLGQLQALGVQLALVTNTEKRFTQAVLHGQHLRHYFGSVISRESPGHSGPYSQPVQRCLEQHSVRPERALLVGDNGLDVAAARSAGVACWTVPYGYNHGQRVAEHLPDQMIPGIEAVLDAVRSERANAPTFAIQDVLKKASVARPRHWKDRDSPLCR